MTIFLLNALVGLLAVSARCAGAAYFCFLREEW
uniref:CCSMST1 family protein n=1 Tax=Siphoviridae sp. ct4fm14 TaxID=2825331 RepID=A0A8S5UTC1_9CAUD|nr:MAG TPA: CCSMST1 family protein [Siphoviridae sp. ct4fm14]